MSGPRPALARGLDALFELLMRPRVRRARRWSFLVALPAGVLIARELGLRPSLEDGLAVGLALAALDLAVLLTVALAGTRLLGRERREVVLDFLMHPTVRRLLRSELELQLTLPRALVRRVGRRKRGQEFTYHRGSWELGFALALLPVAAAEGAIVHLALPDAWLWPRVAAAALHALGMVYLLAFALAPRVYPHRIADATLELRVGALYRARVPLAVIAAVERRSARCERPLFPGDGSAALAASGRVDLVLSLHEPVTIERPLADPVLATSIAVAVDDPAAMRAAIEQERLQPPPARATPTRLRAAIEGSSAIALGLATS